MQCGFAIAIRHPRTPGAGADGAEDGPGLGSAWGPSYEPEQSVGPVHDAAHAQFVAAFDALRPLHQALNP